MHAWDVLGDPVRRRTLELPADGERTSGAVHAVIQAEFGISHPAVSRHLRVRPLPCVRSAHGWSASAATGNGGRTHSARSRRAADAEPQERSGRGTSSEEQ